MKIALNQVSCHHQMVVIVWRGDRIVATGRAASPMDATSAFVPENHRIPVTTAHWVMAQDRRVVTQPSCEYMIRIRGRLGATALSAFPTMGAEVQAGETVLTGSLEDRSAVYGVLAQIEALGLEILELRQVGP
jgi:hypothetical protein